MRKCDKMACATGKPAEWTPIIWARCSRNPMAPARLVMDIYLCINCRDEATVDRVIPPENWPRIAAIFRHAGFAPPDPELTTMTFEFVAMEG